MRTSKNRKIFSANNEQGTRIFTLGLHYSCIPSYNNIFKIFSNSPASGVTLPFGAPLLIFCRPHKFFYCLQKKKKKKKKKKVATFFSVFLIGFLPPWSFLYPQIFFSRRPNAKLAEIWYIFLLCQNIFRFKNCKFGNMPPP